MPRHPDGVFAFGMLERPLSPCFVKRLTRCKFLACTTLLAMNHNIVCFVLRDKSSVHRSALLFFGPIFLSLSNRQAQDVSDVASAYLFSEFFKGFWTGTQVDAGVWR